MSVPRLSEAPDTPVILATWWEGKDFPYPCPSAVTRYFPGRDLHFAFDDAIYMYPSSRYEDPTVTYFGKCSFTDCYY